MMQEDQLKDLFKRILQYTGRNVNELFIAGGLTPENVKQIIHKYNPKGVDVSSGVESSIGKKNPEKVITFINAVKSTSIQSDK